ncbi:helix-turn-helix domain-containing protein [Yersinia kristensenii]|nr:MULTISPECIES: helix-turn-helix domain-containing protein [Yersinia]MBW5843083.1 helix-turn-helix domain-containing protein [Yersinia kristensenii]MDA5489495.1 helix-turn-helix domain-containing protein [Yersinia kristensenii]MDN0106231.1 helix-turn-helix domain-containing protein [Yersinia rochesterensis]
MRPKMKEDDLLAAKRLKEIWDKKKIELRLTQEKAADFLGFNTQATVSQYLNAKIPLNTDTILKFSSLLMVKPEDIKPELADTMNYVRSTGSDGQSMKSAGWRMLKPQHSELIELFERLPESEKEQHLTNLRITVDNYDRLFKELLALRKQ